MSPVGRRNFGTGGHVNLEFEYEHVNSEACLKNYFGNLG